MLINCLQPSPREFKPRQTRLLMGFVEFLNEISRTSTRNIALVPLFAILITGWRTWPSPYRSILADPFFPRRKIFQGTSCPTFFGGSIPHENLLFPRWNVRRFACSFESFFDGDEC